MPRDTPDIRYVTIFSSDNPRHRLIFSILWYSLIIILFGLALHKVGMHHPTDFYKLFAYTVCFVVVLFISILISTGLLSKPLFRRSPLLLILIIFTWGILLFPVVTHFPIDFSALFSYLAPLAVIIMLQLKTLMRERNKST